MNGKERNLITEKKTPLVVGGTQTKVLANSMAIAVSEVTLSQ